MIRLPETLADAFEYDAETGVLTRIFKSGKRRVAGANVRSGDYIRVSFNGKEYPAHRLIWLLVYGQSPDQFIDHINGVRTDNRLANLRLASDAENKRNVGIRSHNTSGEKGVTWDKANKRWLAHATLNGRGHNLGRYLSKDDAASAYREFARKHHGQFLHHSIGEN